MLWLGTAALSGRSEAWDSPAYWTITYPLSIVLAGTLGYLVPIRPWRWALTVMLAQLLTLTATAASFGLLPLGLVLFTILALPPVAAALVMGVVGTHRRHV